MFPTAPTSGRIVHFVLPKGPHAGESRPAIITSVQGALVSMNVQVEPTDELSHQSGILFQSNVPFAEEHQPRTWHWPAHMEQPVPADVAENIPESIPEPSPDTTPLEAITHAALDEDLCDDEQDAPSNNVESMQDEAE